MQVSCDHGTVECDSADKIEQIIRKGAACLFDEIWMSGTDKESCLAILLNGQSACVHYFAAGGNYQSAGNDGDSGMTEFRAGGERTELPNYTVVPLSSAIECAKQFFQLQERPSCITWNEI